MVIRKTFIRTAGIVMPLMLMATGCGSPPAQGVTAKGDVTVGDDPLSGAVITLEPMRGTAGPNASAAILDGHFEFAADAGLRGGRYRVRISMIPAEIRKGLPPEFAGSMPSADAMIDPRYDGASELTCELTPDQTNKLTFTVEFL